MTTTMTEACGCVNELFNEAGLIRCVTKCPEHVKYLAEIRGDSRDYYLRRLGCIADGVPQCKRYERELWASGVRVPEAVSKNEKALEIGCGLSMYAPMIHKLGYSYLGIDVDPFACEWTSNTHCCNTRCMGVEKLGEYESEFDLVLMMHALEHVADAPAVLRTIYSAMRPFGHLILLVPNGHDDPTNPDHWWFFTEKSLASLLEESGFMNVTTDERRVVSHERFIYSSSVKGK